MREKILGSLGVAQVLTQQPFDICKVRQVLDCRKNPKYQNLFDLVKQIYQHEGILAFYKGTLSPLIGIGACVSIQFGVLEIAKRFLRNHVLEKGEDISFSWDLLVGAIAGLANSVVSIPAEHIRIRIQIQTTSNRVYSGSIDAFKKIYSKHGIRGVYSGTEVTIHREIVAYAIYFAVYDELMKYLNPGGNFNILASVSSGGAAGFFSWLISYPFDVAKTKIQSSSLENPEFKSAWDAYKKIHYSEKGLKKWFPGIGVCLLQSVPVNSVTFLTYEAVNRGLKRYKEKF